MWAPLISAAPDRGRTLINRESMAVLGVQDVIAATGQINSRQAA